jgi:hypothetical protein
MLEGRSYCPLLHLRLAEVRAVSELPSVIKNRIFPVVRFRPWLNAKSLDKAFETFRDAFGDRFFGLDLDHSRNIPDRDSQSYEEFRELFNSDAGFAAYYRKVREVEFAVPVLRTERGALSQTERQVEHSAAIGRGLVIRVPVERPFNAAEVLAECDRQGVENRVVIFDCGWGRDLLGRAAQCTALANQAVGYDPNLEIVVGGSSFPDAFARLGDHFSVNAAERPVFNEVRRNLNAGRLTYGDWGSTRPPTDPVPMANIPRIDVAHQDDWECWRSVDGETYRQVAERVVHDLELDDEPDLWGEYMILSTAQGSDGGIKSPAMAAAVRVNLHIALQASFGEGEGIVIPDEPVGEDL